MSNSDSSYYILRYDPVSGTVQYFNGADWYNTLQVAGTSLANGKIFVGSASNLAAAVTPSGLATLSNAGVLTIAAGVVKLSDLSATYTAPLIFTPAADNTAAIRFNDLGGSVIMLMDSTDRRVGVNTSTPASTLHVNGDMRAEGVVKAVDSLTAGTSTGDATAVITCVGTTKGFLPPRMTTTQKGAITSPTEGLMVYDNSLHKLCVYTGAGWETVTSA